MTKPNDNLSIWNALGKTDPTHTKRFKRSGGFQGTSIKPIYADMKMTERFGPCGIGWGMGKPEYTIVNGPDGEVAVYCTVSLWYVENGKQSDAVWGTGGDFAVQKNKYGLTADDEAFKKAFTDALGNAMKHIGMSADVHMGQHDDDKYVTELRREIAAEKAPAKPPARAEPQQRRQPPYPITVDLNSDGAPDWKGWCGMLRKAIEGAVTVEEINAWIDANNAPLGQLASANSEWHGLIHKLADQRRAILAQAPSDRQVA